MGLTDGDGPLYFFHALHKVVYHEGEILSDLNDDCNSDIYVLLPTLPAGIVMAVVRGGN